MGAEPHHHLARPYLDCPLDGPLLTPARTAFSDFAPWPLRRDFCAQADRPIRASQSSQAQILRPFYQVVSTIVGIPPTVEHEAAPKPKQWRASCVVGITSERGGSGERRAFSEHECTAQERTVGWLDPPRALSAWGCITERRALTTRTRPPTTGYVREGGRASRDETTRPTRQPLYQGGASRPGLSGTVRFRERAPQPSNLRRPHAGNDGEVSGAKMISS